MQVLGGVLTLDELVEVAPCHVVVQDVLQPAPLAQYSDEELGLEHGQLAPHRLELLLRHLEQHASLAGSNLGPADRFGHDRDLAEVAPRLERGELLRRRVFVLQLVAVLYHVDLPVVEEVKVVGQLVLLDELGVGRDFLDLARRGGALLKVLSRYVLELIRIEHAEEAREHVHLHHGLHRLLQGRHHFQ